MENNELIHSLETAQDEIMNLRETLANIIPENQELKHDIMSMKKLIERYQVESSEQVAEKERIIEQLTAQIEKLNTNAQLRKSDLSNMSEITAAI